QPELQQPRGPASMRYVWLPPITLLIALMALWRLGFDNSGIEVNPATAAERDRSTKDVAKSVDRSPIALALTPDEKWLVTANQTSGTVSLVDIEAGAGGAAVRCGTRPHG